VKGGRASRRRNQGGRITASTRRLLGAELGDRAVRGGRIHRWHNQVQAMREEGNGRWGQPIN
jgi:hypothetical protein